MTERIHPNPIDDEVASMVDVLKSSIAQVRRDGKNVRPYGDGLGPREKTSDEEDLLLFNNPAEYVRLEWPELAIDQTTGMPITNAQATQVLLQKMGPADYVKYTENGVRLAQKLGGMPNV